MSKRILVVGHCNMDGPRLVRELTAALPEADVERINSNADLRAACEAGPSLLLVNRVPVGFDEEGLDLIKDLHGRYPECTMMLVSDRPEVTRLVNLDCLTYAGHPENLTAVARHPKYAF